MVISANTFTTQNTNNNLRDASFSSYLTNKEVKDSFSDSIHHPFTRKEPFHFGVKKEEDGEIGVFDAEKYFNGVEISTPIPRVSNSTIDANKFNYLKNQQQNRNYKVQYGTSSVGSESSLNSQSELLQNALKNSSSSEISFNKGVFHGKSTSEKKTETVPSAATELMMMNKDFYLQKQEKMIPTYKVQLQQVENPRKKLEVFGSPILDERCKSLSFDMRLTKPSWEASSTKLVEQETDFSTKCDENNYDDDVASDASSDLFEIESLTGNKTNSFFTRTSHVASDCTSPTCYAPSEASIEWSVITASAVEYSAVEDHEDQGSVITIRSPIRTSFNSSSNGKHKINKEMSMPRRRPSKFLGCNSQKSVGVAVDAFTTTYEKQSTNQKIVGKSEMLPQMTKFKVESFGARNEQHGYGKPPLRRSHSPHGAQLLYI
ncbi:hypothetical protein P8452_42783 [Trifolium repens]|nr:hypothetical protein P8452_42783 [Trifolium repens]